MRKLKVGDTVRLSATFLRNTGQFYGDSTLMEGGIIEITPINDRAFLVTVDDAAFGTWKALDTNLELVL